MSKRRKENDQEGDGQILIEERSKSSPKTKKPSLYKVLLHNDDYTTMEFVIAILEKYFHKSEVEATEIMLKVHNSGIGVAGLFTYEIAETKVLMVTEDARRNDFPLKCTMEKSD